MPINQSWGCPKCTRLFDSKTELSEHMRNHEAPEKKVETPEVIVEPKKPQDIKLGYIYTGQCPKCSSAITTLELDVLKKHFVVAHCTRCNKQLDSKEVVRL